MTPEVERSIVNELVAQYGVVRVVHTRTQVRVSVFDSRGCLAPCWPLEISTTSGDNLPAALQACLDDLKAHGAERAERIRDVYQTLNKRESA